MVTRNDLVTTPATAGSSSCHRGSRASGGWFGGRRGLIFGGGAIVVAVALALDQHWLSTAAFTLLLFLLPCAVMMFMCMRGMNHGQRSDSPEASAPAESTPTDHRN